MSTNTPIAPTDLKLTDVATFSRAGVSFEARMLNLQALLDRTSSPEFINLSGDPESNVLLHTILEVIRDMISVLKQDVEYQHQLNAKLIFELLESPNGIKLESEELKNELQYL